jgi:GAF domain-containing protein
VLLLVHYGSLWSSRGQVDHPQSLACRLAVAIGRPVITPDVTEEPRRKQWLWLAEQFDYRVCWSFPVSASSGKIMGSFAIYYQEPREATQHDLDLAAVLTRTATSIISRIKGLRQPRAARDEQRVNVRFWQILLQKSPKKKDPLAPS